jgi:hypothetical protein
MKKGRLEYVETRDEQCAELISRKHDVKKREGEGRKFGRKQGMSEGRKTRYD